MFIVCCRQSYNQSTRNEGRQNKETFLTHVVEKVSEILLNELLECGCETIEEGDPPTII